MTQHTMTQHSGGDGILGIHHVTALASDPQANLDFYTGVLGLRLVKRTVNFDDPGVYHLYYGDDQGRPGTILTFFPWPGARRGQRGAGQAVLTSFSVPTGSLDFWRRHLEERRVGVGTVERRGEREALRLLDPDGMELELVAHAEAVERPGWAEGPVPAEVAIRGFYGVTLWLADPRPTAELLTATMGFRPAGDELSFEVGSGGDVARVELVASPQAELGRIAAGSVHHVAWRVAGDDAQEQWRGTLYQAGMHVTPMRDRQYFHSVYFREPGGVLFELATDPPGFLLDESAAELGRGLKLPPWLEAERRHVEASLPELVLPELVLPEPVVQPGGGV